MASLTVMSLALIMSTAPAMRQNSEQNQLATCEPGDFVPHEECFGACDQDGVCEVKRTFAEVTKGVPAKKLKCTICTVPIQSPDEETETDPACGGKWVPSSTCKGGCDGSGKCWHWRTFAEVTKGVQEYQEQCTCDAATVDTSTTEPDAAPSCDGEWVPSSTCEGGCEGSGKCWHKRTFAEVARGVQEYQDLCECDKSSVVTSTKEPEAAVTCDGKWVPSSSCKGGCDASGMCWHWRTFAEVTKGVKEYQEKCQCEGLPKTPEETTTTTTTPEQTTTTTTPVPKTITTVTPEQTTTTTTPVPKTTTTVTPEPTTTTTTSEPTTTTTTPVPAQTTTTTTPVPATSTKTGTPTKPGTDATEEEEATPGDIKSDTGAADVKSTTATTTTTESFSRRTEARGFGIMFSALALLSLY